MLCGKLITKKVVSNRICPEVTLLIKLMPPGSSEIPATSLPVMPGALSSSKMAYH